MGSPAPSPGVRLAELAATLSLAADLGLGQPAEHAIRSTHVARRIGQQIGQTPQQRATTFWVNLLAWIGCTADSYELARTFGDDIAFRAESYQVDLAGRAKSEFLLRWARDGARSALDHTSGEPAIERALVAHCEVTGLLASRFGLGADVGEALGFAFARWDGNGIPAGAAGRDIPLPARLLHLADVMVAHHRLGGVPMATSVARQRRGTQFDPDLVDAFCPLAADIFDELEQLQDWDQVIASEPELDRSVDEAELDRILEVLADFADLKSPYFLGHSRGVADLASRAAVSSGNTSRDVKLVWRAGLVHDIGRAGVPNTIWDKPTPLTASEAERIRLHDYYTERMLRRPAVLAEIGAVASSGHERLDGSGYHRAAASAVQPLARLLGAADAYHAMGEARPHRPGLSPAEAARQLRDEARSGKLDPVAVDAVLVAAGHSPRRRPTSAAGLTPRETEVLVLVARGASNRRVAELLDISPKTAGSHIEHIYAKIGVSTRAGAALFAVQHGLVSPTTELTI